MQPLRGFAALAPPRGSDFDSFIVFGPALSVTSPSITIISLSSLVWGRNCVIQLFRKSNIDSNNI
jgi:hypothetical protein